MEAKLYQDPFQELPVHMIMGMLHVLFDCHKTTMHRSAMKIMHKFLSNKKIIKDTIDTSRFGDPV